MEVKNNKGMIRRSFLSVLTMFFVSSSLASDKKNEKKVSKKIISLPENPVAFQTIFEVPLNRVEMFIRKTKVDPGSELIAGKSGKIKIYDLIKDIDNPKPVIYFQYTGSDLGWIVLC